MFISRPIVEYYVSPPLAPPYVSPSLDQPKSQPTAQFGGSMPAVHFKPVKVDLNTVYTRVYHLTATWYETTAQQPGLPITDSLGSYVDLRG